jgi:transposase
MDLFHKVRAFEHVGKNKTKIAAELGLDRKTVRKYLTPGASPPRYKRRLKSSRADVFLEFEDFIRDSLTRAPELSAGEIYALIRPRGYSGSERTVQRRLKSWREQRPKERFFEQEYAPGEQAQFDFKESVELVFSSGPMLVHLLFGTLPFSYRCLIKGYPQKTYECFMDGIHSFFEAIGGRTENIRIDNLSPCVKRVRKDGKRDYTDAFEKARHYYDFGVLPCSPGKGNEKGDVERDIQTWARRFKNHVNVHAIVFRDFTHLNEVLTAFVAMENGPGELFAKEQTCLIDLLPRDENVLCRVVETRASSHGTVRVDKTKATYSVPDEWIGLECRVVAGPFEVRITRLGVLGPAVVHTRRPEGENSIKLEHVLKSLLRKPQAMVRWAHRAILFPTPIFMKIYQELKRRETEYPGRAEREFLRIMNLVHHVPLSEIKCALEIVYESNAADLFNEVKELLLIERRPATEAIELSARVLQIPLNPNLKEYDQLIPAAAQ